MSSFHLTFGGSPGNRANFYENTIERAYINLLCKLPGGDTHEIMLNCDMRWAATCTETPADKTKPVREWTVLLEHNYIVTSGIGEVFDALEVDEAVVWEFFQAEYGTLIVDPEYDKPLYSICMAVCEEAGFPTA